LTGESWAAWRTLLVASMGESLTEDERADIRALTGRGSRPLQRVDEFAAVVGRRGGVQGMATLATYIAGLCDPLRCVGAVSAASCSALALDSRVAKIIHHARGLLRTQSDPEAADVNPNADALA